MITAFCPHPATTTGWLVSPLVERTLIRADDCALRHDNKWVNSWNQRNDFY